MSSSFLYIGSTLCGYFLSAQAGNAGVKVSFGAVDMALGTFPGYDRDSRASPEAFISQKEGGEPASESDADTKESPGTNEADSKTEPGTEDGHIPEDAGSKESGQEVPDASRDNTNPGANETPASFGIISGPDGEPIEPQALEGFEEQVLSQLEVTNMFLFHLEILAVFIVGALIFSLVYRVIKHNITSHFT